MAENKPSELLFVRSILPHCKRIGPLWLKNVTNLRQKCREHCPHNANKPYDIFLKLDNKCTKQLNEEIHIVVNLLRKLYREIQPQFIMSLIKCWLNFPEIKSDNSCILTKGDCRGRMKRIDGGKGADKVWRLDTLIGIMFHGLPLTSADSNMIYHTCQHDLCIRPQHLRFKAASVSLVLVLKALEQSGYSINLEKDERDCFDEFVDIAGPFGILELEALRHELVQVTEMESYKLSCSSDDILILDQNPSLKKYYLQTTPPNSPINVLTRLNNDEIKKRLLKRLFESSKFKHFHEQTSKPSYSLKLEKTIPLYWQSDDVVIIPNHSLKRKLDNNIELEYSSDVKHQRLLQDSAMIHNTNDVEENELIEIMETGKKTGNILKSEMTNCLFHDITDSPFKLNFDNFIRVATRSESESTSICLEKKRSSQVSICYSQLKRNSEDDSRLDEKSTNEFLDMIHSMRHQYNPGSSLKMSPNIFSPVSEIEEL